MRHSVLITTLGYALLVSLASGIPVPDGAGSSGYNPSMPSFTPDGVQNNDFLNALRPSAPSCIAGPQVQMLSNNDIYPSPTALIDYQWSSAALTRLGSMSRIVLLTGQDSPAHKKKSIPTLYMFFRGGALLTLVSTLEEKVQNAILQKAGLRLTTKLPEDATCGEMAHWHPLLLFNQESNSINVQRGIDAMIKLVETLPDAEFTIPESLPDVKMVGALKQIQPDIQLQQAVINILGEDAPALILAGLRQYTKELQERLGSTQNKQLLHAVSPNTAWLVAEPSETLGLE